MRKAGPRALTLVATIVAVIGGLAAQTADTEVKITSDTFGGLRARAIGPAVMGGRIMAIDAAPADPLTIYVGAASGGIWKSSDAGTSFKPVFDEHTQSIGALRVDPSNPKIVWAGTGESCVRNSVSVGTGVYRSTDAGDSWQKMGLADSERISKIEVHPKKGDTVLVCATGRAWSAGGERGVYRTTDAGKSWERVLFVNEQTGCSDLTIDPQDPSVLFAGMWQYRRSADFFTSGGPGSGLYRSTDGGTTWKRLTAGLPSGELGRIAVAQAPSRPSVVYALVEAKKTALYRSDNLGETWTEVNASFLVQGRPFYFAHLAVDPSNHDIVYKPGFALGISTDGGRSMNSMFTGGGDAVHSDHHALWINPRNPRQMLLGTDGGVYASNDGAHHWEFLNRLPVSQYYHVSYDMEHPYNVYGGLQDNGTWAGPSRAPGGVSNRHWEMVGFGDGFWAFADPRDSKTLYVEYQGGNILRVNRSTLETQEIKPYAASGEKELRFNWNTPIHLSPSEPGTVYVGAQYLYRSRDRGASWERISPDLTTNDPKRQRQLESGGLTRDNSTAENFTTIYTISESPKNRDLIWAGTDDGNLQITRDGGKSWTNVVSKVPGLPAGTWVSRVEASPHAEGRVYATFDGHRAGDMKTYAYRSEDFGATWEPVAGSQVEGYAFILKEDPVNPRLLFLGTEFGLWISLDGGRQWARFSGDLPKVAVHDIAIHPREHDVILATHGRGIYIIDDITPIRALTTESMAKDVALLPSRDSRMTISAQTYPFGSTGDFVGRNPPEAATITYWLKKRHLFGDLKVEVYDADGKLISTIPGTKRVGINRVEWPMRLKAPKVPPATSLVPAFSGPRVAEGSYSIRLIKAKETLEGKVTLTADPRSTHPPADRLLQQKTAMQIYRDLEDLTYIVEATRAGRDSAKAAAGKLDKDPSSAKKVTALADRLEAFRASLVATSEGAAISGEEKLREKLGELYGGVNAYDGKPTDSQMSRMASLEKDLAAALATFKEISSGAELAAVNAMLAKRKLEPIAIPSREEWLKKQEEGAGQGS